MAKEGVSIWRKKLQQLLVSRSPGEPPVKKKQRKKGGEVEDLNIPKTNMEPKNVGFFQMIFLSKFGDFQVPAVNFLGE